MSLLDRVKALCKERGVSQRKMEQEIGISNGASSKWDSSAPGVDVLQKLSSYFNVSIDYLVTGENKYGTMSLNAKDEKDIGKRMEATLYDLNNQEALMFYGEPLDDATKEFLKISLESGFRAAKINAKQKFTPKKYRNKNE